jgi:hypothetical protein
MPTITIDSITAVAANPGTVVTIKGNSTGLTSVSIEFKCDDDNGEPQYVLVKASDIVFNSNGTYTATAKTVCGCGQRYYVNVHGQYPGGEIVESQGPLTLECTDCCPQANQFNIAVNIDPNCTSDCRRTTSFVIDFQGTGKAGCPANALMALALQDSAGGPLLGGPIILVTLAGGNHYQWPSLSLASGIGYQLSVIIYVDNVACHQIVRPFYVPACEHQPACPTGLKLIGYDIGCSVGPTGDCQPAAQFLIEGTFDLGCGSLAKTELVLDFGDGSPPAPLSVATAGYRQFAVTHQYGTGALHSASVSIVNPTGCSPALVSATVDLHACSDRDCVTCGDPPEPPVWCLCKSCWLFSKKPGKWFCKALIPVLMIPLISLAVLGFVHGWTLLGLSSSAWIPNLAAAIGIATFLTVYSVWCGNCCAACAIWPGVLVGILVSLLLWIVWGVAPSAGPAVWGQHVLLVIFMALLLFWAYGKLCKKEERTQLGPDDWCKEAI